MDWEGKTINFDKKLKHQGEKYFSDLKLTKTKLLNRLVWI